MNSVSPKKQDNKLDEVNLRVWEKGIETEIHFNDLIMRNRTLIISLVTAIFGAAAYALKDSSLFVVFYAAKIHVSTLVIFFGMLFLLAYLYLDIYYYLTLLKGSVNFTEAMDLKYKELGLTTKINETIKYKRAQKVLRLHYAIIIGSALLFLLLLLFADK